MSVHWGTLIVELAMFILLSIAIIFAQIVLSKKESRWLGLLLPTFFFMLSLVIAVVRMSSATGNTMNLLATVATTLILTNIPTAVLLLIDASYRKKKRKHTELNKMNIQDL